MTIISEWVLGRLEGEVTLMTGVGRLSGPQEGPSGRDMEFLVNFYCLFLFLKIMIFSVT